MSDSEIQAKRDGQRDTLENGQTGTQRINLKAEKKKKKKKQKKKRGESAKGGIKCCCTWKAAATSARP